VRAVQDELATLPLSELQSEIIVIDDGSEDHTFREARETGVLVLQHATNLGLGAALGTGFEMARLHEATIVVTLDADGQHDPGDLPRITAPILDGTADVVIGSRMLDPEGMPFDRLIINRAANWLTFALFGIWVSDSQSGLRAFSREAIDQLEIQASRMEVSSEIVAEVGRLRLRLVEVPIRPIYTAYSRKKGQSNLNGLSVLYRLLVRKAS
jgi:glycosyltransferase involved in cell wall biosynthesis